MNSEEYQLFNLQPCFGCGKYFAGFRGYHGAFINALKKPTSSDNLENSTSDRFQSEYDREERYPFYISK